MCAWKTHFEHESTKGYEVRFEKSLFSHGLMFPHLPLYISRLPPREGSILMWAFHLRRFVMKNTARIECQDVLLETILVP